MFGEAGQEEILQPGVEFLEIGRISTALLYNSVGYVFSGTER
jgi:hypothetical protein